MKIIKISAIGSTNDYLKKLSKAQTLEDKTVVQTLHQTQGKGQMGASWQFEIGKSLAFSVFKRFEGPTAPTAPLINFAVSLGVKKGLDALGIPQISIKWPNDILADGKKIGGILIENQFWKDQIASSVIGIGLNVNNHSFPEFPHASSLLLHTGIQFSVEEVFDILLKGILQEFKNAEAIPFEHYKQAYEQVLFRKGKVSTFVDNLERKQFMGVIEGVSNNGMLQVRLSDDRVKEFQLKQITMLY